VIDVGDFAFPDFRQREVIDREKVVKDSQILLERWASGSVPRIPFMLRSCPPISNEGTRSQLNHLGAVFTGEKESYWRIC
jgi:hypothetical protein